MDSLTQISLGAAVLGTICGRRMGRKSLLVGGIIGTIPDLDVFISYGTAVMDFTYHRGFTHSMIFCVLMTFPLAWVFSRFKSLSVAATDKRFNLAIFLTLLTHILLDAMTIYGTQIFWPFEAIPPSGVGSVFIIDPLYTLPLLIGIGAMLWRPEWRKFMKITLLISTLYLVWSIGAQAHVKSLAMEQLPPNAKPELVLAQPTPFNTLLWRILVMTDEGYDVAYYSLFDDDKTLRYKSFQSNSALLNNINDAFAVKRLQWFTKGLYAVSEENGNIIISDLRMGLEPDEYVFRFVVGERQVTTGKIKAVKDRMAPQSRDMLRLPLVWQRIWDEDITL